MPLLIFLGGGILLLDQLSKLLIASTLPLHSLREVIPGLFNLVHVRNPGAAFSILAGADAAWRQGLFVGLTLFVLAIILFAYGKVPQSDRWTRTAYSLITGGALGNLIDRVRMGEVIDFLDFYIGSVHWPAFNVADSAISAGAVMLVISLFKGK
ncbi:MAG: signal peptidase II [Syntrophobacteraceae bacterium]|nr:signal peptidase II [Syntrophobacteraceae bacterium]